MSRQIEGNEQLRIRRRVLNGDNIATITKEIRDAKHLSLQESMNTLAKIASAEMRLKRETTIIKDIHALRDGLLTDDCDLNSYDMKDKIVNVIEYAESRIGRG